MSEINNNIFSFMGFDKIEENKLIEKEDYFLFKKVIRRKNKEDNKEIKIIISKIDDKCYVLNNNKEFIIEKSKINDEILDYVILNIYWEYGLEMDIISKILFSPFLGNFMRIAEKNLHFVWKMEKMRKKEEKQL